MKTIWILLVFGIVLWSCQESILDPEVKPIDPVKKTITIIASASKGGAVDPSGETKIIIGETKIYKATPENGYATQKVTLNGVEQSFVDNTISVTAKEVNSKEIMELNFSFIEKNVLLISKKLWTFKIQEEKINEVWYPMTLVSGRQANVFISFELNGPFKGFFENKELSCGPYPWSLSGKDLTYADQKYELVELTENKLVYILHNWNGSIYRYTYE